MNNAVRGVYCKADVSDNPITPFVSDYITRKRLSRLGFTSSYDRLPYVRSMIYCMIDAKLDSIKEEEQKKAMNKAKGKR